MQFLYENMPQIETEIEKSKKFKFLAFLCKFPQLFDTLANLENSKRSTRKEFIVQEDSSKR